MDYHLLQRQLSGTRGYDAFTHALVRRLHNTQDVHTTSANSAVAWDDSGILLVCAGEDCTLRLWNTDRGALTYKFEPGHTEPITCTGFLPATGSRLLVSAGPSQDIRVTDLERQATRPYTTASKVKTLLPISSAVFASGGDDGKLRCFDSRQRGALGTQQDDKHNVLVDQGAEALSSSERVSILSMSQDPVNQQYIATGGNDAYVRVYDVRMMRPPSRSVWRNFTSGPAWCYCLAPTVLRQRSIRHSCQVSSVDFDPSGQRLLAGYAGKDIYSFDVRQHACSYAEINSRQHQRQKPSRKSSRARRSVSAGMPAAAQQGRPVPEFTESEQEQVITAAVRRRTRTREQPRNQQQQQQPRAAGAAAAAEDTAAAAHTTQPPGPPSRRSRDHPQEPAAEQSMIESPAGTLHATPTQEAEPSPAQHDEEQQGAAASDSSSGSESGSHNRNSSGSDEEVLLAAEVHLLGPDGTVLHTTRIPLHRAPRAAAEAILRRGNHHQPSATTSAAIANRSRHQEQQGQQHQSAAHASDRLLQQRQEGVRSPGMQEPTPTELLPSRPVLQRLHQGAQARVRQLEAAHFAAQERLRALEELHRLRERAEVLRAEQEQLIRLRDALARLAPSDVAEDSAAEDSAAEGRQLVADDPAAAAAAAAAALPQHPPGDGAGGGAAGDREQVTGGIAAAAAAGLAADLQAARDAAGAAQQQLDAAEQLNSSVAAPNTTPGQQQHSTAAAAAASMAAPESTQVPTQQQQMPAQQGFLAQLHATAAGFAVPPPQQQQQQPGPTSGAAVLRQLPVIDAGGSSSAGIGAGRRVRRPRRSSRTVFQVTAEPTTADTDSAAVTAGTAAEEQQQQDASSPAQHSRNSSAAAGEEVDEAEVSGAGGSDRARLRTFGSNMAFMGLGGSGAGSSRNIGNVSPSVVAEGSAAAAFIHGRDPAAAAASGRHRARLQQQQQELPDEQQAASHTSSESDDPAPKRLRRDVVSTAGARSRSATPAAQHPQQQELPSGSLLTCQQQPRDTARVPDLHPEAAVGAADARHSAVAAPMTTSTAVLDEHVAEAGADPVASSLPAATAVLDRQTNFEQQQLQQQQEQDQPLQQQRLVQEQHREVAQQQQQQQEQPPQQQQQLVQEQHHEVAQQQQEQQLQVLQTHVHRPAPPRLLDLQPVGRRNHHHHQQQRRRRRQQQHEEDEEDEARPTAGLDRLFGALMNNIGQALAAAADGQEVEVHIPLTFNAHGASLGQSRRSRTAGAAAAHTAAAHTATVAAASAEADPAAADRSDGAVDRSEGVVDRSEGAVDRPEGAVDRFEGAVDRSEAAVDRSEAAVDRSEAAVDRSEAAVDMPAGPAAMLRAELGLPKISRAQAMKQVHKWQRQRSGQTGNTQLQGRQGQQQQQQQVQQSVMANDPAGVLAAVAGTAQATANPKPQQQQMHSEAASMYVDQQQQPEALQQQPASQQQQPASQQQQQDHQQVAIQQQPPPRRQGVKRKRSDPAAQQLQQGTASTTTTAVAAPQGLARAPGAVAAAEEAEPPADSDAAFVAALSGHRSSRRRRDGAQQPGELAAPATMMPAAAAPASGAEHIAAAAAAAAGDRGSTAVRRRTRSSRVRASRLGAEQHQQQHGIHAASAAEAAAPAAAAAAADVTTSRGVSTRRRRQQAAQQPALAESPGDGGDSSEMPSLVPFSDSDMSESITAQQMEGAMEIEAMQRARDPASSLYNTGLTSFTGGSQGGPSQQGVGAAAAATARRQRMRTGLNAPPGVIPGPAFAYNAMANHADHDDEQDNPFRFSFWHAAAAGAADNGGLDSDRSPDSDSDTDDDVSRGYSCCYSGHLNLLSSRNAAWLGSRGEYVVSGSDDGCLFVWDAASGNVINVVTGGDKSVRRVQVNPKQQLLLATCGPEPVVRLWSPTADVPADPAETAAAVQDNRAAAAADGVRHIVNNGFGNLLSRWAERVMGGVIGLPGLGAEGGQRRGGVLRPGDTAGRVAPPRIPEVLPAAATLAAAQEHGAAAAGGDTEGRRRRYQTRSATAAAAGQDMMHNLQRAAEVQPVQQQQEEEDDSDEYPPLESY